MYCSPGGEVCSRLGTADRLESTLHCLVLAVPSVCWGFTNERNGFVIGDASSRGGTRDVYIAAVQNGSKISNKCGLVRMQAKKGSVSMRQAARG